MVIANPTHWKEPFYKKGPRYDKVVEMIAELNTPTVSAPPTAHKTSHEPGGSDALGFLKADDTTYVHKVNAQLIFHYYSSDNTVEGNIDGVRSTATGTRDIRFAFAPPEWLRKYADDNSLSITMTTMICRWNNSVSASYISQVQLWWVDGDTATYTNKFNDTTDLGNGTTGFRADTFNLTDTVLAGGDVMHMQMIAEQSAGHACKIQSFDVTYTIA